MGADDKQVLSVSLTMTPELASELQRETGALEVARAYVIDSPDMAKEANSELRAVKARITRLKELKGGFVAPAKQIIANAEALFDPAINANTEAEKYLKGALLTYQQEEERKADEARRAREAEERAARQKAEQEAAAARARAQEQAAAAQKAAREAEERRVAAEREGNARAAAAAAAEAAKQQEKAQAALETGEAKAVEAVLAASAQPLMTSVAQPTKIAGFSMRDNWQGELLPNVDIARALDLIIAGITGVAPEDFKRRDLLASLQVDTATINKLAKGLKSNMNVPGFRAVNKPVGASRAA